MTEQVLRKPGYLEWVDALKGFAILGILLNHLVESFGYYAWFTNPSEIWPDLATRIQNFFPYTDNFFISTVQFLGWLGDSGPGVFILLSGLTLTISAMGKDEDHILLRSFFYKRLNRIFPLYITIHLLILGLSLLFSDGNVSVNSPRNILSLLGLRFTDSLFFYLNPSWWFIWLILQFYLVFPLLYKILMKWNIKYFLLLTIGLTVLFRGFGLAGIRWSSLFTWMTGIFFGTRLAEFSIGMILGRMIYEYRIQSLGKYNIFLLSLGAYTLGLIFSIFYFGTLFSNILVSLGLSGLFYSVWMLIKRYKITIVRKAILYSGVISFPLFLFHQPLLIWVQNHVSGMRAVMLCIIVLILAFPASQVIEIFTNNLGYTMKKYFKNYKIKLTANLLFIFVLSMFPISGYLIYRIGESTYIYIFLLLGITILLFTIKNHNNKEKFYLKLLPYSALVFIILHVFIFPLSMGKTAGLIALSFYIICSFFYLSSNQTNSSLTYGFSVILILFFSIEFILRSFYPVEAGRWGEYPALKPHPTRVYALKPNSKTKLHYNNYQYEIRTNSYGLAGPDIQPKKTKDSVKRILLVGDAFTMPEGVEYSESYAGLLQSYFETDTAFEDIEVINAGVTGYGPVEQFPQLTELVPLFKPDLVLYQFFINEYAEINVSPKERLINIGLYEEKFSLKERIFKNFQIFAQVETMFDRLKETMTGRPGKDRYNKSLLTFFEKNNNSYYSANNLDKIQNFLEEMDSVCTMNSAEMLILYAPGAASIVQKKYLDYFPWNIQLTDTSRFDLQLPFKHLKSIADGLGLRVLNPSSELAEHSEQPVYFSDSWHWNKAGHRVIANYLVDYLVTKSDFTSE